MAEDVQTGGLMKFRHDGEYQPKLDDTRKQEIREAYAKADERKAREKRNKIIFWIVLAIVIIALGFLVWKFL